MAEPASRPRPLSPHLQIFRPPVTMVTSILHRITGGALYFGSLVLVIWLMALADGPQTFDRVSQLYSSWPGQIILFGYSWALLHHIFGGIRHFLWDLGFAYGTPLRQRLAWVNLLAPPVLALLFRAFL